MSWDDYYNQWSDEGDWYYYEDESEDLWDDQWATGDYDEEWDYDYEEWEDEEWGDYDEDWEDWDEEDFADLEEEAQDIWDENFGNGASFATKVSATALAAISIALF